MDNDERWRRIWRLSQSLSQGKMVAGAGMVAAERVGRGLDLF